MEEILFLADPENHPNGEAEVGVGHFFRLLSGLLKSFRRFLISEFRRRSGLEPFEEAWDEFHEDLVAFREDVTKSYDREKGMWTHYEEDSTLADETSTDAGMTWDPAWEGPNIAIRVKELDGEGQSGWKVVYDPFELKEEPW